MALFYGAQFLLVYFLVPARARSFSKSEKAGVRAPLHEICSLLVFLFIAGALQYWLWPSLLLMPHSLSLVIGLAWALYIEDAASYLPNWATGL